MALSSDEIIKNEIIQKYQSKNYGLEMRAFPQSSSDDQKPFGEGGLTFGVNNVEYGSCDACWVSNENWIDPLTNKNSPQKPIIAIEGTDALNRGSSGNAQYQRFHHALGAVKAGIIGVYYLKKGKHKIQEDLFGMAYYASKTENGYYLVIDDLSTLDPILENWKNKQKVCELCENILDAMYKKFKLKFDKQYKGSWDNFSKKRSTIIFENYVIKFSGRMKRNFTEGKQRAGHIALGEMYLTKYYFPEKLIYYLWPRMSKNDITYLDLHKPDDKEWTLLRKEKSVKIITLEDLDGVEHSLVKKFNSIQTSPLKKNVMKVYKKNVKLLEEGIRNNKIKLKKNI